VIGQHEGIHRYTIGQRRGLGGGLGTPQYVVSIDALRRRVHIGPREALASSSARVGDLHWLIDAPETGAELDCEVQIRYRRRPQPARLTVQGDGSATVRFLSPEFAVTPGQAAVFYDGDVVLGGGFIEIGVGAADVSAAAVSSYSGEKATDDSASALRS
jgi:tRNA-specific 2-thiouridylase